MPIIRVDGPKIEDIEKRRNLVAKLTNAAAETYGLDKSKIIVPITENGPTNIAVGGKLKIDW